MALLLLVEYPLKRVQSNFLAEPGGAVRQRLYVVEFVSGVVPLDQLRPGRRLRVAFHCALVEVALVPGELEQQRRGGRMRDVANGGRAGADLKELLQLFLGR